MQWWIDTIGKLGPGIIAVLVLFTTRRQNRWQNTIAVRAALVEDQKFRLALLERRNDAIEKVRFAVAEFWVQGSLRQEAAASAGEALRIAELVFDDTERAAIEAFLRQIWQWQSFNRKLNAYRDSARTGDDARYQKTVDDISEFEGHLMDGFEPLLVKLKEAARVRSVPAIIVRGPWWQKLVGRPGA